MPKNFERIHSVVLEIFTCLFVTDRQTKDRPTDRLTDRLTGKRPPDYHVRMGVTFCEKINSPTHNENFALLIGER